MTGALSQWRNCFLLGLATLLVSLGFGLFVPDRIVHPMPGWTVTRPILAFEMATTPDHLRAIFGTPADAGFAARLSGMIAGNWYDYLFMVVYAAFVCSFFFASAAALDDKRWRSAGALGIVAALSDAGENALLQSISYDFAHPQFELGLLPIFVWTKFGLLALACGAASLVLFRQRAWPLALPCLVAPVAMVLVLRDRWVWGQPATAAIALGLLAMTIMAGWRTFRPKPA